MRKVFKFEDFNLCGYCYVCYNRSFKIKNYFNIAVIILITSIFLLKQGFQKRKVVNGKTTFFVFYVLHFLLLILFVLTVASDRAVLYGNIVFSILVFPPKKNSAPVFRISFRFSEFFFNVKAFK